MVAEKDSSATCLILDMLYLPHGGMNVRMSRVTPTTSISVDPLQPVLRTVTGDQILKVVRDWNILGLCSTQKILGDGIGIVAKRDLDWAFKSMNISIIASALICFMLLHEWKKLLGGPTLGLKVIIVGR